MLLVLHNDVAEAAVVGCPHDLKGQGIYAYITLMQGVDFTDELSRELITLVNQEIGPIAKPDFIQPAPTALVRTETYIECRHCNFKNTKYEDNCVKCDTQLHDARTSGHKFL